MNDWHRLLQRQLKKHLKPNEPPPSMQALFDAVSQAYHEFDQDRLLLERSMDLSSYELSETYEKLKITQAQLIQSEKISAVGRLAAGVAHGINDPLAVILGFAQSLVKNLPPQHPLELPLRSIEREAQRCKALVQSLITFSDTAKSEKEEVDICEAVETALSLVMTQTKVKNVSLVKEFETGIPRFFVNRTQIQQAVINLCNNAVDAMPGGGTLTVAIRKIATKNAEMVEIKVQDTGQGISPEIRSKIFEPFFTTKEVGQGTGMGLFLVFEIVRKHSGGITVDSEPGKGSTFRICLPLYTLQ